MNLLHAFLLLLIASILPLTAAPSAEAMDEIAHEPWPFEVSDLEPDPRVTWGQLENGARYFIMPNQEPRERVSLRLYVRAGSLQEQEDQRGLAHFIEHMGFNGTENFGPGTLVEYFQRLGMSFGADTNAYTSFERTVYMIEVPDTRSSSIDEGLLVLRDYAGRMLLEEDQIEAERRVVLSEMRTRDSVGYRTALAEYNFLLPEALIPERFPIGTAEVLGSATREDFLDFYDTWYRPERTVIGVVGEVEPDEAAELIKNNFGDFEPRAPAREEPDLGNVVEEGRHAHLHTEVEAPSVRVSIQAVMPYERQPDTAEVRIARLHRSAAMQIISQRLDTLARQEDAPFSRGSAYAYEAFNFLTNSSMELVCEPEQWDGALRVAEQELRRALEHGFQPAELREVQAELLNAFEEAVRRASTRQSARLAEAIISSISDGSVFTMPETELELMRPAVEAMSLEDVQDALRETWSPEGRFIFVTGNLELEDAEETILAVYEASLAEPVEPMEEITEAEFAYTDFGTAGEVAEQRHVEDLDVHQVVFDNQVRLNVKTTDFQANTIHMLVRVGHGRLTEPEDKEGIALLSSSAFTAGGLGEHSSDELRRILAGRNVGVSFSVGEDAFEFSGSTTPTDLLLQLQLAAAYLTDPGYRPEALRLSRTALREVYRRARHTAQGVMQAEVSRMLASGDHRIGLPPEEAVGVLDLDHVRRWLAEPLAHAYVEITLVGDIEVEEAIQGVAQTFGALPEREEKKATLTELRQLEFPADLSERRYPFESAIPNGITAVYWPTTDIWDIRQTRRLQTLARIFSDRMRVRIREDLGEAYSPYAVNQASETFEDYGLFFGMVGIAPERASEVADVVVEIGAELRDEGVTEDELVRAIRPTLNSLEKAIRDNGYWLGSVLASSQEYPQRLEWARHMISDYESIQVDEVSELARRYLHPDRALRVIVVPVPEQEAE